MLSNLEQEEMDALKSRVDSLQLELTVHKALILGLLSELGANSLRGFNPFPQTIKAELSKFPAQSDEREHLQNLLEQYLDRAEFESKTCPVS